MKFDPYLPYNNLPFLPPKENVETTKILKKAILANKALSELKGVAQTIPNQDILINTLILEEARDSSEIENIITTRDNLYRSLAKSSKTIDPNTKEVINYRESLWKGYNVIKQKKYISINTMLEIHSTLLNKNSLIRTTPGTALQNDKTGKIIYTPPDNEFTIKKLLKNLEEYINDDDDIDPLIKMAIIHSQFEAIHPFYDGNGRTGRILNVLYLVINRLLDLPILYLSSYIISHKNEYYTLLKEVITKSKWENWILYILEAIEHTSKNTLDKINMIRILIDQAITLVKKSNPRIYSKELIELLFHQPYCKINLIVDSRIAERHAAGRYLTELEKIGLLSGKKIGNEIIYINLKLYNLFKKK